MNDKIMNSFSGWFTIVLMVVAVGLLFWQNMLLREELVSCYKDQTKDLVHISTKNIGDSR